MDLCLSCPSNVISHRVNSVSQISSKPFLSIPKATDPSQATTTTWTTGNPSVIISLPPPKLNPPCRVILLSTHLIMRVCVLITQLCPTLCDSMDYSPPGSSVRGILQARILEWVPFPSPWDLPDPGIEPMSPALQADALPSELRGKPLLMHASLKPP